MKVFMKYVFYASIVLLVLVVMLGAIAGGGGGPVSRNRIFRDGSRGGRGCDAGL